MFRSNIAINSKPDVPAGCRVLLHQLSAARFETFTLGARLRRGWDLSHIITFDDAGS